MAIINKHSTKKVISDNENSYLFNYLDTLGLDLEMNNDFQGLKDLLKSKKDYPYDFDACFEPSTFSDITSGFVLYVKDGDRIVATYSARRQDPETMKLGLSKYYSDVKYEELPVNLRPTNLKYMYSSCQWVDSEYLGKRIGVTLDLIKKHIIFDRYNCDVNYAIHKVNDSMISYHKSKLFYSDSKYFFSKPDGNVGGAGSSKDVDYNLAWIYKNAFINKLSEIKITYP